MNSPTAPPVDAQLPQLASVLTPWLPLEGGDDECSTIAADPEKHRLFQQLTLELITLMCPWLLRLVTAAQGQFIALHGRLYVAIPATSGDWIEIPELSAQLGLLPWREDGETAQ